MPTTRRVTLVRRPIGQATPDCFEVDDVELAPLEDGEVRVAVEFISVDAGTRTMLRGEGFHQQVGLGETVRAGGVGRIVESKAEGWETGQAVIGGLGAQTLATLPADEVRRVDDTLGPLSLHLGILGGSTGVTAWIGIREVAKPGPGDDFVVSAAAGAVGSIAGQIAKRDGARVIGIAGGPVKTAHLVENLGFDAAIDYKGEDVDARLRELAPEGIDVYFDNVGGDHMDAALGQMRVHGRIAISGMISAYHNRGSKSEGVTTLANMIYNMVTMRGFVATEFMGMREQFLADMRGWMAEGKMKYRETILEGIEQAPQALIGLFEGANTGKMLVRLAEE